MVTGASRGIGKAIALALGAEGAKVVVNYANSAGAAEEVAAAIKASGGDAMTVCCNTGDKSAIDAMFKQVVDEWGTVDVLVNNAGAIAHAQLPLVTTPCVNVGCKVDEHMEMFVTAALGYHRVNVGRKSG